MNLQIREFEQNIVNYINGNNLPLEVKRLVVQNIFVQINQIANNAVNQEIQNLKREQEKSQEEHNDNIKEKEEVV